MWTVLLAALVGGSSSAEEAAPSAADAQRLGAMTEAAKRYQLALGQDGRRPLKLRPEPVFRWTNPVQGSIDGAVYLWTSEQGRPAAVLGVYPTPGSTAFAQEFQSLAEGPLIATKGGRAVWTPDVPGAVFKPLPGAEPPAPAAGRRLLRMKAHARDFQATFLRAVHTEERDRIALRLLPQPLYRYEASAAGVVDGALFAFAQGTDPQALLLIEARRSPSGDEWRYALARFASGALDVRHKGVSVWSAPKHDFRPDPNRPYLLLQGQ